MKTPAPTVIRAMDMYFPGESSLSVVDRAVLFVAMQGSKIVGTVVLKFTNQKTQAELARLFVHATFLFSEESNHSGTHSTNQSHAIA